MTICHHHGPCALIRFPEGGFVLVVKAIFLVRAFTGHVSLWLAILADTGVALLVIADATRLLRS